MHLLNFHFFISFFKRLILYAHSDFTLVFLHISIKFVSYQKNFRLCSFSTHELCWVSMAFCCNVELLWLSSVLQPIALDQDPLVCINVSPPACSEVPHSDEYQNLPLNIKDFLKKSNYISETILLVGQLSKLFSFLIIRV